MRHLGLLLFLACAAPHVPRSRVTPKTWVGQHVDRVTDEWGYADETTTSPSGNALLIFNSPRAVAPRPALDGASMGVSVTNGGKRRARECVTYVEVDSNHIVVKVDFKGRDC